MRPATSRYSGGPSPSGLSDVLELMLDRGLVIDVYARVSLIGIELLTIDARIVVAGVDTYLRFAEAVGRIDLQATEPSPVELARSARYRVAKAATSGALDAVGERLMGALTPEK
jgi:gas vesicle structural protein